MNVAKTAHTTMITSTKTDWKTSEAILTSLRTDVFIVEQGISLHDEWDDKDKHAQHYLAHKNTLTVGCARLVFDHTQGKIGRVAILQAYRRQKIASHLLQFIIADAIKMGLTVLTLDAQIQVTQLYEAFGFISQGDIFWMQAFLINACVLALRNQYETHRQCSSIEK